jgi:hypothetical protein
MLRGWPIGVRVAHEPRILIVTPTKRWAGAASEVLALLVVGCLSSCTSSSKGVSSLQVSAADWNATVDRTIPDASRAARVKELGRQLAELQKSMAHELVARNQEAVALSEDYAPNMEEARQLARNFRELRRRAFAQYRDIVFAMREEVSAPEWKALVK